jgi:hypothetical protein
VRPYDLESGPCGTPHLRPGCVDPRVPLEGVRDFHGNQDTKTTIRYLALRSDGMISAKQVIDQVLAPLGTTPMESSYRMGAKAVPFRYR